MYKLLSKAYKTFFIILQYFTTNNTVSQSLRLRQTLSQEKESRPQTNVFRRIRKF